MRTGICLHAVSGQTGIGDRIRAARAAAGLSQGDLAQAISVRDQTVSSYERGVIGDVMLSTAARIAAATGVRLDWLASGEGPMCEPGEGEAA